MSRSQSFRDGSSRGGALVEFAFILPLLVVLILGTFEVTNLIRTMMKFSNAAQAYANIIAANTSGPMTLAKLSNACAGAQLVLTPFSATPFSAAVASVTNNGGTISQDWHDTTVCNPAGLTISGTSLAPSNLTPNNGDNIIVVTSQYSYSSPIAYVLPAGRLLSQTAFARPRINDTLACTDCTQH